jgi:uncharacterized membrane protein (UPF0127 family)
MTNVFHRKLGGNKKSVYHVVVKKLLFFLSIVVGVFFVTYLVSKPTQLSTLQDGDTVQLVITREGSKKLIGSLFVSVVVSPSALERGLSGRSEVPMQGMLFVLPEKSIPNFWMKDMLFDLDLVWIDNTTVVDITKNAPAPDKQTPLDELPRYSPTKPATLVLEIPAGQSEQLGLKIGDTIVVK